MVNVSTFYYQFGMCVRQNDTDIAAFKRNCYHSPNHFLILESGTGIMPLATNARPVKPTRTARVIEERERGKRGASIE